MNEDYPSHITLFLQGDWLKLADLLKTKIESSTNVGDSVQLTCWLSHYGCCQINLGNQFESHIIYQFFKNEKTSGSTFSIKEQAFVYRFLALYTLFDGDLKQAKQYYEKSIAAFQLLDEAEEEAIMLLEAYRWLYCLLQDRAKNTYIFEKIQNLPAFKQNFSFQMNLTKSGYDWIAQFWNYIDFFSKKELQSHPLITLFRQLHNELKTEGITEGTIYSLIAKVNQYKHPLLKIWAYLLAASTLNKLDYLEEALQQIDFLGLTDLKAALNKNTIVPLKMRNNSTKLSFSLFRDFAIFSDDKCLKNLNWKRKKAEEVLIYLLTVPNQKIEKEQIIEEFYPEVEQKKAENRLYGLLHEINRQFVAKEIIKESFVTIKGGKVQIDLNIINEIDLQSYLKLYSVGKQLWYIDRKEAVKLFEKARRLYDHELVPHIVYADWLIQLRRQLKEKQIDLLQKLYNYYEDANIKEQLLNELLECEPFNENIIYEKISLLHLQGRTMEAKQFYEKQKELLKEELGLELKLNIDSQTKKTKGNTKR